MEKIWTESGEEQPPSQVMTVVGGESASWSLVKSYYRCTHNNCRVKKRVERLSEDCRMVITTYEGRHTHLPCDDTESDEHEYFK